MATKNKLKCDCCLLKSSYVKPVAGHILCDRCHVKLHQFSHLLLSEKGVKLILEKQNKTKIT